METCNLDDYQKRLLHLEFCLSTREKMNNVYVEARMSQLFCLELLVSGSQRQLCGGKGNHNEIQDDKGNA